MKYITTMPAQNVLVCAMTSRDNCIPTCYEYLAKVTRHSLSPLAPKTGNLVRNTGSNSRNYLHGNGTCDARD